MPLAGHGQTGSDGKYLALSLKIDHGPWKAVANFSGNVPPSAWKRDDPPLQRYASHLAAAEQE
jgi:hypothetical protein